MSNATNQYSIDPTHPDPPSIPKVAAPNLSQLVPKTYSTIRARVVIIKSKQKRDELGDRNYIFGICEDQTFRTPFICYKPYPSFFHDGVFDFQDAYVHEFEDGNLLLIITERSSITYLPDEDPAQYDWNSKISDIRRPTGSSRVTIQGVLSQISSTSGLVQRCEKCARVAFDRKCPNGHEDKLFWSIRIAGRLADQTGSINIIIPQQATCKLIGRTVGEILQLTEKTPDASTEYSSELFTLQIPESIEIGQAYADNPDQYRSPKSPVVVDLNESRIIYPNNIKPRDSISPTTRSLDLAKSEDRLDLTRLAQKLLELQISNATGLPKVNGILLTEKPINLYSAENAKLYVGFRFKVSVTADRRVVIEAAPAADMFESVLDYVAWRRERGASPTAIKNTILNYRRNVIFAPNGELAAIINVNFTKAQDFTVPVYDLSLPAFWKQVHDTEVTPGETPLIVVRSYRLDLELTFPPSCIFFNKQSLRTTYGTQRFIDRKRQESKHRIREILDGIVRNFSIGNFPLPPITVGRSRVDARQLLLSDIREKLLGRNLKASGSVIQSDQKLYFIARFLEAAF